MNKIELKKFNEQINRIINESGGFGFERLECQVNFYNEGDGNFKVKITPKEKNIYFNDHYTSYPIQFDVDDEEDINDWLESEFNYDFLDSFKYDAFLIDSDFIELSIEDFKYNEKDGEGSFTLIADFDIQYGVEYRSMHTALPNVIVADTREKAEEILELLQQIANPEEDLEDNAISDNNYIAWDRINDLSTDSFEIRGRMVDEETDTVDDVYIINHSDVTPSIFESRKSLKRTKNLNEFRKKISRKMK